MGPKHSQPHTAELLRRRLDEQINMKHPLLKQAALIDWAEIERTFAKPFTSGRGRPALPSRLIAGLLYLHHTFDASDWDAWLYGTAAHADALIKLPPLGVLRSGAEKPEEEALLPAAQLPELKSEE